MAGTSVVGSAREQVFSKPMEKLFRSSAYNTMLSFSKTWLKLDLAKLAAVLTITGTIHSTFGTLSNATTNIYWWLTRFLTASISIAANDRLNKEVLNWINVNVLTRQKTRILAAGTEVIETDTWYSRRTVERNDYLHEKRIPITYSPTFGITWFFYKRTLFMVKRVHGPTYGHQSALDEYAAAPTGKEPLVVMCLSRSIKRIKDFLETCRDFAETQREAFVTVRTSKAESYSLDGTWDTTILRPIRPLETVHFDEQVKAELVADITNYLDKSTRQFYTDRGIPYRRGFLLHGPPGTGKTSLSLALAGKFGLELYLIHIPSVRNDGQLERLFTNLPPRCIVLLEDIDAVGISKRRFNDEDDEDDEDDDEEKASHVSRHNTTLAGLLNVLDGVSSQEGRIVFMTSNFAEKLDKALTRPGRIDRMIFLGNISRHSAEQMFLRMYADQQSDRFEKPVSSDTLQKLAAQFTAHIPDSTFTPAQLQGYLLERRSMPHRAVDEILAWVKEEKGRMDATEARARKIAERRKQKKLEKKLKNELKSESGVAPTTSG